MGLLGRTCLLVAVTAVFAAPLTATADDPQVRVFQRKPFLRRERVEIAPYTGLSFNDALVRHYYFGARGLYHLSEYLSAGLSVAKAQGQQTALFEKVQTDYSLHPSVSIADWMAMGDVSYALLHGKFVLFNSFLVHLDSSVEGGLGAVGTAGGNVGVGFSAGLGPRYFLTRWLSVNLALRHYAYLDEIKGESTLVHATTFLAGVGFFFPDFEYRTFR